MSEEKVVVSKPKHSLLTNPRSKHYDKDLAKRRAKEKARRKANKKNHK